MEGHRLGVEYRQIVEQLEGLDPKAGLDRARLTRERDAIRGVAQIRGWTLPDRPEGEQ